MKVLLCLLLSGCLMQPTNPADIAGYNSAVLQLLMPIVTALVTLVGFVGLWIKSNVDKREIAGTVNQKADEAAMAVAMKAESTAAVLAASTEVARDKVLDRLEASHKVNYEALEHANNMNEKILHIAEAQAALASTHVQDVRITKQTEPVPVVLKEKP